PLAAQPVEGLLPVLDADQGVDEAGALQAAPRQGGVAVVVLGQHDLHGLGGHVTCSLLSVPVLGVRWPAGGGTAGRATKKVLPPPAVDSAQSRPPCRSTMRCTSVRPIPSPPATSGCRRRKAKNTCDSSASGMPRPLSLT